ncbi:hypothetical protein [Catenuloplanes atrovinosus]|uniref:Adhesin domain-containing protein n=1 Tax=Catenuloplanes atrovinosus TaxID=137266 RepID=A0AAE4C9M9_9ACTN|nr:hypothetical protein [Catenuloplanes atrovinosus]MDR7276716.1 hypothetical protein [Catenuloplanes atrovinosus]
MGVAVAGEGVGESRAAGAPAGWPSIADYWPDAPHRIGPEADVYHLDDTEAVMPNAAVVRAVAPKAEPSEAEPRDPFEDLVLAEDLAPPEPHWNGETAAAPVVRRRGRVLATVAFAALLLAGLTAAIVVQVPDGEQGTTAAPPVEAPAREERPALTASAPLDGREEASFALLTEVTILTVRSTALDGELFRISAPEGGGVRPNAVTSDGEVRLFLEETGDEDATATVEVLLSDEVRWSVRLLAGVDEGTVDLSAAAVSEVTLAGGATSIDLSLPSPDGTLPISLTKGANRLTVRTPARVPARAAIRQGAGTVEIDGATRSGIAKGEVFQSRDWRSATDRLDLDASAGLGTLRIEAA